MQQPSASLSEKRTTSTAINMVADAVVYHPTVAHYLRFVATSGTFIFHLQATTPLIWFFSLAKRMLTVFFLSTVGRDKVLRTLQYFARFYSWYLFRTNALTKNIAPWEAVKKSFSLIRRGMRVGKNVEHFKAAAVAADAKGMDPVLRYCAIARQLSYGIYLTLDIGVFVRLTFSSTNCPYTEDRNWLIERVAKSNGHPAFS